MMSIVWIGADAAVVVLLDFEAVCPAVSLAVPGRLWANLCPSSRLSGGGERILVLGL